MSVCVSECVCARFPVTVRELANRRLLVFGTPDAIAMAAMSPSRVAWMTVVARSVLRRQALQGCTPR